VLANLGDLETAASDGPGRRAALAAQAGP
jgi:hypothetical protein